jgi:hypothetical protein
VYFSISGTAMHLTCTKSSTDTSTCAHITGDVCGCLLRFGRGYGRPPAPRQGVVVVGLFGGEYRRRLADSYHAVASGLGQVEDKFGVLDAVGAGRRLGDRHRPVAGVLDAV